MSPATRGLSPRLQAVVALLRDVPDLRLEPDLPLARQTTYEVGGPADWGALPGSPEALARAVRILRDAEVPVHVLGRGSNVLISDEGLRGVVLLLRELDCLGVRGETLVTDAGVDCTDAAAKALEAGLTGLEFFHRLPGSVGGAAFMNARAFEQEMSQVWRAAQVVTPQGRLEARRYAPTDFSYKRSPLQETGELAARLELQLTRGDPARIRAQMESNEQKRQENGELAFPSCGCVFKNDYAFGAPSGRLIDGCGLKGFRIGQAQVSATHANFVVNLGGARAADIRAVIEHVRREVALRTGHHLACEVRFLGAFEAG